MKTVQVHLIIGTILVSYKACSIRHQVFFSFNVTPPLFTKLAKSHISAQLFVRVFVLGWYTYFETAQVLFSLCFREKGVRTLKIYESLS